jgi:signal transduction histidine kinase
MNWSGEKKWIFGGFGLSLLLFSSLNFISYKNTKDLSESAAKVQETYEVLNNIIDLYANMAVAESGRRGYIVSGSGQELERHRTALVYMQSDFNNIKNKIALSNDDATRLQKLNELVKARINLFKYSIELYQKDKTAEAKQAALTGKSIILREHILTILSDIKVEQENWLQVWTYQSRNSLNYRLTIELIGTFLSFCVLFVVYLVLYRQHRQRQKVEEIQQKLAREKELGDLKINLFSMISHEFRTPLSVILASSQLLKEAIQDKVDRNKIKNIDRIQASTKLMNRLITDLLTFTRAEAGKLECNLTSFNIESFCLNSIEDIQFCITEEHELEFVSKGAYSRACLDEKLCYSILTNLLLNAIKYSPQGGRIELTVDCSREQIIFQVKDEGIGILSEDIAKICDPFYRGQNIDNIVGNGLGLAVVKKCLELQHGEIAIENNLDKGTTFMAIIPQGIMEGNSYYKRS